MWSLVIMLLIALPGVSRVTVLHDYPTWDECQVERNRVGYEMAAAYPYERDFMIACQLNPRHES